VERVPGHATRDAFFHLTTMYYDSEENSSASVSDNEGEFDDDNIDDGDAQSSASYGENLRVRD